MNTSLPVALQREETVSTRTRSLLAGRVTLRPTQHMVHHGASWHAPARAATAFAA